MSICSFILLRELACIARAAELWGGDMVPLLIRAQIRCAGAASVLPSSPASTLPLKLCQELGAREICGMLYLSGRGVTNGTWSEAADKLAHTIRLSAQSALPY